MPVLSNALSSATVRSVSTSMGGSSDAEEQALEANRFCGLLPSASRYRAVRAAHADVWTGRAAWLTRPRDFIGFDQEISRLPLRMRLTGTSLAARSGSVAQRDIADAFSELGRDGCSAGMITQTLLYAPDSGAWHAIQNLVRYGLLDVNERTRLVLPEGAPVTSAFGKNFASHVHRMALLGLNAEPGRDRNQAGTAAAVSLRQRFEDLRDAGVNLNLRDGLGRTPLHYAAINNNFQAVRALLKAGANVDPRCKKGDTPLIGAIKFGSVGAVEALLNGGADFNAPCLGAKHKQVIKIEEYLGDRGTLCCEVVRERVARDRSPGEWAPIHWAASLTAPSSVDTLRLLLIQAEKAGGEKLRARIANLPTGGTGQTPLQFSIRARDLNKVQHLLDAGADPNKQSRNRIQPLQLAAVWGSREIAELLISHGADLEHSELLGGDVDKPMFPIDTAIRYRNEPCAIALLAAAPHQVSADRLGSAATAGMVTLFEMMAGGNGSEGRRRAAQVDKHGNSMIHCAAMAEKPDMVTLLVKHYGLDPGAIGPEGLTPVDMANHFPVWKRLIDLGAPYAVWVAPSGGN